MIGKQRVRAAGNGLEAETAACIRNAFTFAPELRVQWALLSGCDRAYEKHERHHAATHATLLPLFSFWFAFFLVGAVFPLRFFRGGRNFPHASSSARDLRAPLFGVGVCLMNCLRYLAHVLGSLALGPDGGSVNLAPVFQRQPSLGMLQMLDLVQQQSGNRPLRIHRLS